MDRTLLQNGPHNSEPSHDPQTARASQDVRFSQDTCNNLAVQPAASTGKIKLKKKAVKMVGVARSAPPSAHVTNSLRPSTSLSTPLSSPVPGPTGAQLKSDDGYVQIQSDLLHLCPLTSCSRSNAVEVLKLTTKVSPPDLVPTPPPSKAELPAQSHVEKVSLDDMFARLSAATSPISSKPLRELPPAGLVNSAFSLNGHLGSSAITRKPFDDVRSFEHMVHPRSETPLAISENIQLQSQRPRSPIEAQQASSSTARRYSSQDELEQEYLRKAAAYVNTLSSTAGSNAFMIKAVSTKLRVSYSPELTNLQLEEAKRLRPLCNIAVTDYVNERVNISTEPLTAEIVGKALYDSNGDFLVLCAALVEGNYIALENLEQVTGLCQHVLDVLPKVKDAPAARSENIQVHSSETNPATLINAPMSVPKAPSSGPHISMEAWPAQQKREYSVF